jgi:hypothetical protein
MGNQLNDGGRGIVLDVTQEVINNAVERSSGHCVIADAVRAMLPTVSHVSVDLQTIRFSDPTKGKRYIYLTPATAQRVLVEFDQGVKPEPFTMRLGKPAQIVKMNLGRKTTDGTARKASGLPSGTKKKLAKQDAPGAVPTVLGGNYPPTAALSNTRGRRRTFGLRSMKP